MHAKTLLLLSTTLAAPGLFAQLPSTPVSEKLPAPFQSGGPAATMTVSDPRENAPAPEPAPAVAALEADPNETSPQIAERFNRARRLIARGAWKRARRVLERAITDFPESRHLHALYSDLLFFQSRGSDQALLARSAQAAVRAMEIGLGFGVVDSGLTDRLSRTLESPEELDRLFGEALARDPRGIVFLHYARGLSRMGDPRAEETFARAVELEGEGDAMSEFGEWLLDQERDGDALDMLPKSPGLYYLHFLRGLAMERQDRADEAAAAYSRIQDYSRFFPLPARFRIPGSAAQGNLHFDDEDGSSLRTDPESGLSNVSAAITTDQAINGLSYLIWGEARGENYGGMLAEGWVVRARTLRGTVGNPACPAVSNSGATLADKYRSVMCQGSGSQFNGVCLAWCSNAATVCSSTTSTNNAAYDVFWGYGPDPVSGHCPSGISQSGSSYCDGSIKCYGDTDTYKLRTALFNLGTSSTCATHSCAPTNYGKVCGNGNLDNCFYSQPSCVGIGRVNYTGSFSAEKQSSLSSPFQTTVTGNHNGHLEGPDSQDFDLYLQQASSSTGPWTDVAYSTHLSSTEEINYQGAPAWYRWRAFSYRGTGSFSLCTKRP